jgi:hypothetical protein
MAKQDSSLTRKERVEVNFSAINAPHSFSAAFVRTANLVPLVAALASAAIYIALPQSLYLRPSFAIAGGIVLALIIWTTVALPYFSSTTADKADVYSYNLLVSRYKQLTEELNIYKDTAISDDPGNVVHTNKNIREAENYLQAAWIVLFQRSSTWVSGIGYVNLSRLLHRSDESLILIRSMPDVIASAAADDSRLVNLKNSSINNRKYYRRVISTTLQELDQKPSLMQVDPTDGTVEGKFNQDARERRARTMLREVRFALNQFYDDQWEKQVHARNNLIQITIVTGLSVYILLAFAILAVVPISTLIAGTLYFLIGAIVGLLSRLYEQSKADTSIENVHLARARLMASPLISGLAALGGVVVTQKLATSGIASPFDTINAINILAAAAFGLAPNLFFNAIQNQKDINKTNAISKSTSID